jgi:hypothetical protein
MRSQRVGKASEIERLGSIDGIMHRPFQLDADEAWWAVFETHRCDVRLSGRTIVQLRDGRRVP